MVIGQRTLAVLALIAGCGENQVAGDARSDAAVDAAGDVLADVMADVPPDAASIAPSFGPAASFPTGNNPQAIAVGDVNGDGRPDVATANNGGGSVSVLLDTTTMGANVPSLAAHVELATGANTYSVAFGDFNGDGKPDLAVVNRTPNTVSVLLNTTITGSMTPSFTKTDFATGVVPQGVAVADFNGDAKVDLVVGNYTSGTASILLNTTATGAAAPTFSAQTQFQTQFSPQAVAVGDFNGDGRPDVVVASPGQLIAILINTTATNATTPSFAPMASVSAGDYAIAVAVGDLNADGKPDIVVTNYTSAMSVSVLFNTTPTNAATASFAPRVAFPTNMYPRSLAIGDYNQDGKPDLVVGTETSSASVYVNTTAAAATTPSFSAKLEFPTNNVAAFAVATGDLNQDGKPDLAIAGGAGSVSVLLAR